MEKIKKRDKDIEKIHCKGCNTLFKPSRPNKVYCNDKCRSKYYEQNHRTKNPNRYTKIKLKRKNEQLERTEKGVFTYEEIGYIVSFYNIQPISQIAKKLNRTKQSIESKIRLLKRDNILSKQSNIK